MVMSLDDIRRYVRLHMDVEVEDLPDEVLDPFIAQGFDRIVQSEQRWPFYETSDTFTTVIGGPTPMPTGLARADAFIGDQGKIVWIPWDEGVVAYNGQSGIPVRWSQKGDQLYFFPTPDQAYTITYSGYRSPTDWMAEGAGGVPDLPAILHQTVALWALYRSYAQQEDIEMSSGYKVQFDEELRNYGRRLVEMPLEQPLILNGGTGVRVPWPPLFDWQVS